VTWVRISIRHRTTGSIQCASISFSLVIFWRRIHRGRVRQRNRGSDRLVADSSRTSRTVAVDAGNVARLTLDRGWTAQDLAEKAKSAWGPSATCCGCRGTAARESRNHLRQQFVHGVIACFRVATVPAATVRRRVATCAERSPARCAHATARSDKSASAVTPTRSRTAPADEP
jgi:hypothetical protein